MKKILSLLVFCFVGYNLLALSFVFNRFSGSVLCGDLSIETNLPDSLQKPLDYTYSIALSDTSNDVFIEYYLSSKKDDSDTLRKISIDINPEFSELPIHRIEANWKVHEDFFLNGDEIIPSGTSVLLNDAYPAYSCYQTKGECNDVTVYRKSIRKICSPTIYHKTAFLKNTIGDSVFVEFQDSTSTSPNICLAEGSYIHTDSAKISDLSNNVHALFQTDTSILYCFVEGPGCGPVANNKYLATYDFTNCVISSFEDFNIESVAEYYPNPVQDVLFIPEYTGEIKLTDQMGSVFNITGDGVFNVSELPKGIYVLSVSGKGKDVLSKVLIQ